MVEGPRCIERRLMQHACGGVITVSQAPRPLRARVRAALRAAAERSTGLLVRTAFCAAAARSAAPQQQATERACAASAGFDAAAVPSRFSAPTIARERVLDTAVSPC